MHENDANRPVLTCKALDARNMWVLGSATTPASQPLLVKITQIADPLSSECGSIFRWLMCYGSDPQVAQQRHCAPSDDFWYIHDGSGFKDGTSIPYLQEPDTGRRMLKSGARELVRQDQKSASEHSLHARHENCRSQPGQLEPIC